jgi:purine-binding chemotaxis protein CheW
MSEQNQDNGRLRLLCFTVGAEHYCLDMAEVRVIESSDQVQYGDQSWGSTGWLNAGESTLPVFSMAAQLDLPPGESERGESCVVMVDTSSGEFGLKVSRIAGVIEVPEEEILPLPALLDLQQKNVFRGCVCYDDKLFLFTDPSQLHPQAVPRPEPLAERRQMLPPMIAPPPRAGGKKQLLLFSTGLEGSGNRPIIFGLSVTQVVEIAALAPTIPVPSAPPFVLGLINWHNYPAPIIDLNARLGLESVRTLPDGQSCLLIVRTSDGSGIAAFRVRQNTEVLNLPVRHRPLERELKADYSFIRGAWELPEATLIMPDPDHILAINPLSTKSAGYGK